MQYIYERPQIDNSSLAEVMAYAYDQYYEVKKVAANLHLIGLTETIEREGQLASEQAGFQYISYLGRMNPLPDIELAENLETIDQKYQQVLDAAEKLGNSAVIGFTEKARAEDERLAVEGHQAKLKAMLARNTAELVLADDEGNFLPEPEVITTDDVLSYANEAGVKRATAIRAWEEILNSRVVEKLLLKPTRLDDVNVYDTHKVILDSLKECLEKYDDTSGTSDRMAWPHLTPARLTFLREFLNARLASRHAESEKS